MYHASNLWRSLATLYIRARDTGDGRRFDVRYRRGGRYSKVEHGGSFRTKREAAIRRDLIADWLAAAKDPKAELDRAIVGGDTFRQLHAEWLASRRNVTEGTKDGYRFRSAVLLEQFGEHPVDHIQVRDVIDFVGLLDARYKPGTVRLFVAQLRMVLDFAGVPNVARDRRVELPRVVRSEPEPPDKDAYLAMLERLENGFRLPVIAMEQLGTRVSETLSLTQQDIDVASVRIKRESSKGQRVGRIIDAPHFLVAALKREIPFRVGDRNKLGTAMRFSGFSPHDLRHRRASLWHQQGVPAVELARRLGHAKPSMSLDVYQTVMPLQEVPPDVLAAFLK